VREQSVDAWEGIGVDRGELQIIEEREGIE